MLNVCYTHILCTKRHVFFSSSSSFLFFCLLLFLCSSFFLCGTLNLSLSLFVVEVVFCVLPSFLLFSPSFSVYLLNGCYSKWWDKSEHETCGGYRCVFVWLCILHMWAKLRRFKLLVRFFEKQKFLYRRILWPWSWDWFNRTEIFRALLNNEFSFFFSM